MEFLPQQPVDIEKRLHKLGLTRHKVPSQRYSLLYAVIDVLKYEKNLNLTVQDLQTKIVFEISENEIFYKPLLNVDDPGLDKASPAAPEESDTKTADKITINLTAAWQGNKNNTKKDIQLSDKLVIQAISNALGVLIHVFDYNTNIHDGEISPIREKEKFPGYAIHLLRLTVADCTHYDALIKQNQEGTCRVATAEHQVIRNDVVKSTEAGSSCGGRPSSYPGRHHIHKPPRSLDRLMTQLSLDTDHEQPVISHHLHLDPLPLHKDRPHSSPSNGNKQKTIPRHEDRPCSSPSEGDGPQRTIITVDVSFEPAVPAAVEEELGYKEGENREGGKEGDGEGEEEAGKSLPTPVAMRQEVVEEEEGVRLRELESTANITDVYLLDVDKSAEAGSSSGGRPSSYPSRHHIHKPPRSLDHLMMQLSLDTDHEQPVISYHLHLDPLPLHEDGPHPSPSSGDKQRTIPRHEDRPCSFPSEGNSLQRTIITVDVSFEPAVPAAVEEELGYKEGENRKGGKEVDGEGEEEEGKSLPTPVAMRQEVVEEEEGVRLRELESTANITDVYLLDLVGRCQGVCEMIEPDRKTEPNVQMASSVRTNDEYCCPIDFHSISKGLPYFENEFVWLDEAMESVSNLQPQMGMLQTIALFWTLLDTAYTINNWQLQLPIPAKLDLWAVRLPLFMKNLTQFVFKQKLTRSKLLSIEALPFWNEQAVAGVHFSENWQLTTMKDVRKQLSKNIKLTPKRFQEILGELMFLLHDNEFLKLSEIIPPPVYIKRERRLSTISYAITEIYPYILQKIKMWGCHALNPDRFFEIVEHVVRPKELALSKEKSVSRNRVPAKKCPVSRLDFLSICIGNSDCLVAHDIIQIISKFFIALPLIMCNTLSETNEHIIMLPLLRNIVIRWESQPGHIVENFLFRSTFKIVVSIRVGSAKRKRIGKSTILNQVLQPRYFFSSRDEPCAKYGKPVASDGTVEFTWLTRETCVDGLWLKVLKPMYTENRTGTDEVILLANLHGDVSNYFHYLDFFQSLSCSYLIFIMSSVAKDGPELKILNDHIAGDWKMHQHLFVENDYCTKNVSDSSDNDDGNDTSENTIDTSTLTSAQTLNQIYNALKSAILAAKTVKNLVFENFVTTEFRGLRFAQSVDTKASLEFCNLITCNNLTCKKIKQMMHQSRSANMGTAIQKKRNEKLQQLVEQFIKLLRLPPPENIKAVAHIEKELSQLSCREASVARRKVLEYQEIVRKDFLSDAEKHRMDTNQAASNDNLMKLKEALASIDEANLGLEHFFREVTETYQIDTNDTGVKDLPQYCAQLLISGCALELLNGDNVSMPGNWICSICNIIEKQHVEEKKKPLKVFVLSIIGLQSSGKSTLLNALFGCNFAVSVGRCTRGLFMRLVFLECHMRVAYGFDALLIIDTEGLGSIEKKMDNNADQKDRQMATFAMGVSDLTIINVMGEAMSEMTDILQIAILAMARLGKKAMASDILLVQHVNIRDEGRLSRGKNKFCDALRDAFEKVSGNSDELGVLDLKCLDNMIFSIQKGDFLKLFRPICGGGTAFSRPSEDYHEDVVELYKSIFEASRAVGVFQHLSSWSQIADMYWKIAELEDFASRFKNIKEMIIFLEREQAIAALKESIDLMFRFHHEQLEKSMREQINKWDYDKEKYMILVDNQLRSSQQLCTTKTATNICEHCKKTQALKDAMYCEIKGKDHEKQTIAILEIHIDLIRKITRDTLSHTFDALQVRDKVYNEFSTEVAQILEITLQDFTERGIVLDVNQRISHGKSLWERITNKICSKSVIEPLHSRFTRDLESEYYNVGGSPEYFLQLYEDVVGYSIDLVRLPAVDRKQTISRWHSQSQEKVSIDLNLSRTKVLDLTRRLTSDATTLFTALNAKRYEEGLIRKLRRQVAQTIQRFEEDYKIVLVLEYTWKLHIYALQKCYVCAERKEKIWDEANNPFVILKNMKEDIMQKIDTRLQYGFSSASDGSIAGKALLNAVQKDAKNQVELLLEKKILEEEWIQSPETIRLTFFEELVKEIKQGNKSRAVQYFLNPKLEIEKWYIAKVDYYQQKNAVDLNTKIVANGVENHRKIIKVCQMDNIKKHIESSVSCTVFLFSVELEQYKTDEDVTRFKEYALKELRIDVNNVNVDFTVPSQMPTVNGQTNLVMGRLGCTEACRFCGAMCWSARGHDVLIDGRQASEHCTTHQPSGLNCWHDSNSKQLRAYPCYKRGIKTQMHYDEYKDVGIEWKKVMQEECLKWKFCRYDEKRDFEELMRWFFFMLNADIAIIAKVNPCPLKELQDHDCIVKDIESILKRMRQK